jgi:hypothetical protein
MTLRSISLTAVLAAGALVLASTPAAAQAPAPTPTTQVLATLSVNADIVRADLMKTMPREVRDTVKLYLDGKIQQWYSRSDGRGVVFIVNATSVDDAKAMLEQLPLVKGHFATFDYVALGPLSPLRMLIAEPPAAAKNDR